MLDSFQTPPADVSRLTGADLTAAMAQLLRQANIETLYSSANGESDLFPVVLDLTGAGGLSINPSLMSTLYPNGYKISKPFKSVAVVAATDSTCQVQLIPGVQTSPMPQGNSAIGNTIGMPLSLKDSFLMGRVQAQGLLVWNNQPGKSITLIFSRSSEFRSGSQTITLAGGVTLTEGSSINSTPLGALGTSGSLAATASAAILSPANSNRKVTTIQVNGGIARIGDSTVTKGGNGIVVQDGGVITWRNTGALYWIIESGAPVATADEET